VRGGGLHHRQGLLFVPRGREGGGGRMREREMGREMREWEKKRVRMREREQDGGCARGRKRMREGGCRERGELNMVNRVLKVGRRGTSEERYMKTIYACRISEVWKVKEKRSRVNELQEKWGA
jgi:hypothetical protein